MWFLFYFYHFYLFVYWCVGLLQSKNWCMFNKALTGSNKKVRAFPRCVTCRLWQTLINKSHDDSSHALLSKVFVEPAGWYCSWLVLQLDAKCQGVQETDWHWCRYLRSRSFSAAWEKVVLRHCVACKGGWGCSWRFFMTWERESAIQTWSLNTDGLGNSSIGRELKLSLAEKGVVSVIPDRNWDID